MSKTKLLNKIKNQVVSDDVTFEPSKDAASSRDRVEGTRRIRNAKLIKIDKIKPDKEQPRKVFDAEKLQELASSIEQHGILQPITVEYVEDEKGGYYKIISGERRYQASKMADLKEIPCIIYDNISIQDRYARQIIENLQREDLSPIEKAVSLLDYKNRLGQDAVWADVERLVGLSKQRRKQYIALLDLPEHIQQEIVATGGKPAKNQITEKHARALLLLNHLPEKQIELFEMIKAANESLTGDDAITKAREFKGKKESHRFSTTYLTEEELLAKLEQKVEELKGKLSISG